MSTYLDGVESTIRRFTLHKLCSLSPAHRLILQNLISSAQAVFGRMRITHILVNNGQSSGYCSGYKNIRKKFTCIFLPPILHIYNLSFASLHNKWMDMANFQITINNNEKEERKGFTRNFNVVLLFPTESVNFWRENIHTCG